MTTQTLRESFYQNHQRFVDYIGTLREDQLTFHYGTKWNAGQQLEHVYLCLIPLVKALASKEYIIQKFGKISRPVSGYNDTIANLRAALANGGKAPEQFVPASFDIKNRKTIADGLIGHAQAIRQLLEGYTDEELDTLALPHPLLGILSLREMFYVMAYHATHHHKQTEQNLMGYNDY